MNLSNGNGVTIVAKKIICLITDGTFFIYFKHLATISARINPDCFC